MEHKNKCEQCKKPFKSKRRDAKYCGVNCRNRAAYQREFDKNTANAMADDMINSLGEKGNDT